MTYSTVANIKLAVSVVFAVKAVYEMCKDFFVSPIGAVENMFTSRASRLVDTIKVQIAKFTALPYMMQSTLRLVAELSLIGILLLCGLSSYILYVEIFMLLVTAYFGITALQEWYANR